MSSVLFSLPDIYASYRSWVSQNPQTTSDFETTAKWVSYFIAGRINNSHIVSELVYSLSNLLVLYNDRIINSVRQIEVPGAGDRLKLLLTILEYSEVFLELSATKVWGNAGRWLIIVAVQVFKCVARLILVYHHKESIIQNPPIPTLQRKNLAIETEVTPGLDSLSFTLKRSGKIIRKVDSAPPIHLRTWKPVERQFDNEQTVEKALKGQQLIAETVYILKPIVHLSSLACFGNNTWRSWCTSLMLDLGSLYLYRTKNNENLTAKQKLQLSRRCMSLLLYLLRSPYYDRYSRDRIQNILKGASNKVPLASVICNPLAQYLPFWQSTYFYMWST